MKIFLFDIFYCENTFFFVRSLEMCGDAWSFEELHGVVLTCMELCGDVWSSEELYGDVWSCMGMHWVVKS